jgi:tetratricopeptide (TPR) repeat protein
VVLNGDWSDALLMKASALIELKRNEEAVAALERAIAIAPEYSPLFSELGYVYQQQHDWQRSLETYQKAESAAQFASTDDLKVQHLTRALRGQGYNLVEMDQLDEAEKLYRRSLSLDEKDENSKRELRYIEQVRDRKKAGSGSTPQ